MEQKRQRGRPKGALQYKHDGRYLDMVADLMVKNPSLKKTPAIATIVFKNFPEQDHSKTERRLLRAWNKTSDERLTAAVERKNEAKRDRRVGRDVSQIGDAYADMPRVGSVFSDLAMGNEISVLRKYSELSQRLEDIVNPPALRWLEEQNRTAQRLQDMIDPPFMRRIREQQALMERLTLGF